MTKGLVLAAPSSGCGKTVITLALLRALRRAGRQPGSLKIGPDYIDPGFHRAASGGECRNYDPWAMRQNTLDDQIAGVAAHCDIVIAEGVTGLFDGAADGTGSTADAANRLRWPILLIADVRDFATDAEIVIIYCNGGECEDSIQTARYLTEEIEEPLPFEIVHVFEGGIQAWSEAGYERDPENCEP